MLYSQKIYSKNDICTNEITLLGTRITPIELI